MAENGILLRTARPDDAPQLLEIYRPYVEKTAISFECEIPSLEEFRGRIVRTLKNTKFRTYSRSGGTPLPAGSPYGREIPCCSC